MPKNRYRRKRRGNGLSRQVSKNTRKLKKVLNVIETKHLEQTITVVDMQNNCTYSCILFPQQEVDAVDRIGDQIFLKNLTIRGLIDNKQDGGSDGVGRIIVYLYKDPNGVDVGTNTLGPLDGTNNVTELYDWN